MYASLAAKAKTNRRGRAVGGRVRVAAAQAVQAMGQQCGGLRAPLCRRHARRVENLEGCHGGPACSSNQQAVSQCDRDAVSQRSVNRPTPPISRKWSGALSETGACRGGLGMRRAPDHQLQKTPRVQMHTPSIVHGAILEFRYARPPDRRLNKAPPILGSSRRISLKGRTTTSLTSYYFEPRNCQLPSSFL